MSVGRGLSCTFFPFPPLPNCFPFAVSSLPLYAGGIFICCFASLYLSSISSGRGTLSNFSLFSLYLSPVVEDNPLLRSSSGHIYNISEFFLLLFLLELCHRPLSFLPLFLYVPRQPILLWGVLVVWRFITFSSTPNSMAATSQANPPLDIYLLT